MTKKEITAKISTELDITQEVARKIVQMTLDRITDALVTEGRIELRDFGVFEVVKRKGRDARNPRTGEKVVVPARMKVKFTVGKEMGERVGENS